MRGGGPLARGVEVAGGEQEGGQGAEEVVPTLKMRLRQPRSDSGRSCHTVTHAPEDQRQLNTAN
jgi:hypothetical protein